MLRVLLLATAAALTAFASADARSRTPPLPPGRDPGGVAVALFSAGIDYTRPGIARRLARDGEGELIGWDFEDNDNRPFNADGGTPDSWGGDATALIAALGASRSRIIPVRIKPGDQASLARAVAFVAQTPARIVVLPMWSPNEAEWQGFQKAAAQFGDLLFIAAAGDDPDVGSAKVWPAAFGLANVLVVAAVGRRDVSPSVPPAGGSAVEALVSTSLRSDDAGGVPGSENSRFAAMLAADTLASCAPYLVAAYKGAALKAAVLAQLARPSAATSKPLIERCADPDRKR